MFEWIRKKQDELNEEQAKLIAQAELLLTKTREIHKKEGIGNLTSSLMLRDDEQLVEKAVKSLRKTPTPGNTEKLSKAILRLQTSAENILGWNFKE